MEYKKQIQDQWVKQEGAGALRVNDEEWEYAKVLADHIIEESGSFPPFKIDRKELAEKYPEFADKFNHSMLVLPDPDSPLGYKIGAMARSKIYSTGGEWVKEGILGYGGFGVAKIVQWESGEIDAVKIEGNNPDSENEVEKKIMEKLGYLRAEFIRYRNGYTDWIFAEKISDKRYIVQKRHAGKEMHDYFYDDGAGFSSPLDVSSKHRLETALKAALAIKGLHELNIIQADIKPANFIQNWQGDTAVVVPIDFGISLILEDGAEEVKSEPKGTDGYMASELRDGRNRFSKASDIYALGAMFEEDLKISEGLDENAEVFARLIIDWMKSEDFEQRPSIEEAVAYLKFLAIFASLSESNEYEADLRREMEEKFEAVAENVALLDEYLAEVSRFKAPKEDRERMANVLDYLDSDIASEIADDVKAILADYCKDSSDERAMDRLVSLMKENLNRDVGSVEADSFNLDLLQILPADLQDKVCEVLGIEEGDKDLFLKGSNDEVRKKLDEIIGGVSGMAVVG